MRLIVAAAGLLAAASLFGLPVGAPPSGRPTRAAPAASDARPTRAALAARAARVTYLLGNDPRRWTTEGRPGEPRPGGVPRPDRPGQRERSHGSRLGVEALRAVVDGEPAIDAFAVFGGSGSDEATAVTTDGQGNIFLAGVTTSIDLPVTAGAAQRTRSVPPDCFVAKLDPTGSNVLWLTYLGGNNSRNDYTLQPEHVVGIRVDAQGHVFVAGWTQSTDFPTTTNAWQSRPQYNVSSKGWDGFLAKLSPQGSSLVFSTYVGGRDGSTLVTGLDLDPAGNAYVTGATYAASYPATAMLGQPGGRANVFVTKFSAAGSMVYSTRFGGESSSDWAQALAVDGAGQAHVAGFTSSRLFPGVSSRAWISACPIHGSSCYGGFLSKLSAAGDRILYSSYLGGATASGKAGIEIGGVAVDLAGNIYVAGTTGSTTLPIVNGAQTTYGGGYADAFLASLRPDGQVRYAAYLGGGGSEDYPLSVTADPAGVVHVVGLTQSTDLRLFNPMAKGRSPSPLLKGSGGGAVWSDAGHGLCDDVRALVVDPLRPGVMYAATGEGVYKTTDGGSHWYGRNVGLRDDPFGRNAASALALEGQSPDVLYVSTVTGTYKSVDGAERWDLVDETARQADAIVADPRNPGVVLIAGPSFGIRRSTDRGATWTDAKGGIGPYPSARGTIPVGPSRSWLAISSRSVFRSDDGGLSWAPSSPVLTARYLDRIVSDPARWDGAYVFGDGLFRTTDAGLTWTQVVSGSVGAFAVARRRAGTWYLGISSPPPSGPCLKRSTDRGATWQALWPAPPPGIISALVADPHKTDVVYAVVPLRPVSFLATIAPDGRLLQSTYVPILLASASAVDVLGGLLIAGAVSSPGEAADAFVARIR